MKLKKHYRIKYDLPPTRGIYRAEIMAENEEEALKTLAEHRPGAKVREIKEEKITWR